MDNIASAVLIPGSDAINVSLLSVFFYHTILYIIVYVYFWKFPI